MDLLKSAMDPGCTDRKSSRHQHPYQSDLGSISYDEAGAINEGIADYFSYYINSRSKIGEWGLGRFLKAARPLSEDDSLQSSSA